MDGVIAAKQRRARLVMARSEAAAAIGVLRPGARVVGVTKGQFSLLDLVEALLEQVGPADVLVSTWTPGKAEMERVLELLESGYINQFQLLVDRSFPSRHPYYVDRVEEICGEEAIRMTRTHGKFALIAAGEWKLCIRTSMNFNRNPRLEQFDLDDDARIYALFEGVARDLFTDLDGGLRVPQEAVHAAFGRLGRRRRRPPPGNDDGA